MTGKRAPDSVGKCPPLSEEVLARAVEAAANDCWPEFSGVKNPRPGSASEKHLTQVIRAATPVIAEAGYRQAFKDIEDGKAPGFMAQFDPPVYGEGHRHGVAAAREAIDHDPEIKSLRRDMAECDCHGRGYPDAEDHDSGCMLPVFDSGVLHARLAVAALEAADEGTQGDGHEVSVLLDRDVAKRIENGWIESINEDDAEHFFDALRAALTDTEGRDE